MDRNTNCNKGCPYKRGNLFGSATGFLSMEQIQKKYHISKATICKKCKKHKVERLISGKYKLINEFQFLEALKQKEDAPAFIKALISV
ncbi:MAG: hypothetical protein IPP64_06455 [Bacteroidetes bacterium]|nr:hypothetical protein [Bacteroidota bacterium]